MDKTPHRIKAILVDTFKYNNSGASDSTSLNIVAIQINYEYLHIEFVLYFCHHLKTPCKIHLKSITHDNIIFKKTLINKIN